MEKGRGKEGCVGNFVSPSSHSALLLPSVLYSSPFERSRIDPGKRNPGAECIKGKIVAEFGVRVGVSGPVTADGVAVRGKIKREKND